MESTPLFCFHKIITISCNYDFQPDRKNGDVFYSQKLDYAELKEVDMQAYFADPYCSWQRGANENGNGHIRKYFPKVTDFSKVTEEELQAVVFEINNRPRKILGYKTPTEVFIKLTKQAQGVAR